MLQARAEGGRSRARRGLRLGQLRDPRRQAPRRAGHRHHALRAPGRARARAGPRRPASASWWTSRCATTASWPASASTPSPASAWSSTWARRRSTPTPRALAGLLEPGGRLLNHGIARLRHSDPAAGPVLRALRVPRRRAAAPLPRAARARARGLRDPPRRGLSRRLRGDAAPLGAAPGRAPRRGASGWPGAERVRVWRLYLRAARNGFETGFTSIYQVRAHRAER